MTVNKWKLVIGGHGAINRVELNGTDITDKVYSVVVEASADSITTVNVVYVNNEVDMEINEEEER